MRIRIQQLKLMRIHADPDPDPKPCANPSALTVENCKLNNFRPLDLANNNTFQVLSLNLLQEQVPHKIEFKLARSQTSTFT